ncbi:MAG: hypothetical protein V1873_07070 [Verrucomicrobiota bacterium]
MSEHTEPRKEFLEPEVVTYQRDELVIETVFTGDHSRGAIGVSDRHLKRNFRSADAKRILARLIRLP